MVPVRRLWSRAGCYALFSGYNQIVETGQRLGTAEEGMSQQLGGRPPVVHRHLQGAVDKVFEHRRQGVPVGEVGFSIRRDEINGLEGVR